MIAPQTSSYLLATSRDFTVTEIIGVINEKGGVGKSSVARLIAREYAAADWETKIADLDPGQGTSTEWKLRREENEVLPNIAVEPFRKVSQALKHIDAYDLLVFDGPPKAKSISIEIAQVSKLVVLPTGLALDDLRPTVRLAHVLVDAGIPTEKLVFALCRVGDSESEISEAKAYIEAASYLVLEGTLPEKTSYRRASDLGKAFSEVNVRSLRLRAEEMAQNVIDLMSQE